jgi:hypothetical protein
MLSSATLPSAIVPAAARLAIAFGRNIRAIHTLDRPQIPQAQILLKYCLQSKFQQCTPPASITSRPRAHTQHEICTLICTVSQWSGWLQAAGWCICGVLVMKEGMSKAGESI